MMYFIRVWEEVRPFGPLPLSVVFSSNPTVMFCPPMGTDSGSGCATPLVCDWPRRESLEYEVE